VLLFFNPLPIPEFPLDNCSSSVGGLLPHCCLILDNNQLPRSLIIPANLTLWPRDAEFFELMSLFYPISDGHLTAVLQKPTLRMVNSSLALYIRLYPKQASKA
jgi:hypothetical protein